MKTTHTTTETKTTYTFTRGEILLALAGVGLLPLETNITQCFVRVPGGGDYSNMNLDLRDHPLVIETSQTTES